MNILNWIVENKEWFFSGIGIAIVSCIYGVIKKITARKHNEKIILNQSINGNNNTQIGIQQNKTKE